jgi:hypothetical protein
MRPGSIAPGAHGETRGNAPSRRRPARTLVPARMARIIREGTDTAMGMSAQQRTVTTNLGTLTSPTSRSLKALCPRR